jgi:hypothetical protein
VADRDHLFVRVNADGSIRELTADEREYLNTDFNGADGARPYIKRHYEQRDGWGSIAGFLYRDRVPPGIIIQTAENLK